MATGKNVTESYVYCGFSPNGAKVSAYRLLTHAAVKVRVDELGACVSEAAVTRAAVDREWVLRNLKENVERSMQHEQILDSKGLQTGEYRYEGSVANRALELIGKELGMFVERSVSVNVTAYSAGPDNMVEPNIIDLEQPERGGVVTEPDRMSPEGIAASALKANDGMELRCPELVPPVIIERGSL